MIQFFVLGASTAYGIGGEHGGWADKIKQKVHQKAFGPNGEGEKYEVLLFGKAGAKLRFVKETTPALLEHYSHKNWKRVILLHVGGNDVKAIDRADNFVSSPEDFKREMKDLLSFLKGKADALFVLPMHPYVEEKTAPKISPLTGGLSFFFNDRRKLFNGILSDLCKETDVTFIDLAIDEGDWIKTCMYDDGLHPNDKGHTHIAGKVWAVLEPLLSITNA